MVTTDIRSHKTLSCEKNMEASQNLFLSKKYKQNNRTLPVSFSLVSKISGFLTSFSHRKCTCEVEHVLELR